MKQKRRTAEDGDSPGAWALPENDNCGPVPWRYVRLRMALREQARLAAMPEGVASDALRDRWKRAVAELCEALAAFRLQVTWWRREH